MSVLKYFKNTLRSPPIGRQALSVIFFLQIRNEVVRGDRGLSPPPRATAGPSPRARQGDLSPPWATGVSPSV